MQIKNLVKISLCGILFMFNSFAFAEINNHQMAAEIDFDIKNINNLNRNAKDINMYYAAFSLFIGLAADEYDKKVELGKVKIAKPAEKKEIIYFDEDFNLAEKEVANGYYREILGEDEKGFLVVQDFYQDTKTPQTAPFLIKKGGNVKSGDFKEAQDFMLWFDKNKKISSAVVLDEKGEQISPDALFYVPDGVVLDFSHFVKSKDGKNPTFAILGSSDKRIFLITRLDEKRLPSTEFFYAFGKDGSIAISVEENEQRIYDANGVNFTKPTVEQLYDIEDLKKGIIKLRDLTIKELMENQYKPF